MPVLVSAVVLVGVLCALDLVLTLAVIRRLRDHTVRLSQVGGGIPELAAPGTRLGTFTATSLEGGTVSTDFFTGPTVVGVLSTTCPGCQERLPEFARYLAEHAGRPALVVVQGEALEARE